MAGTLHEVQPALEGAVCGGEEVVGCIVFAQSQSGTGDRGARGPPEALGLHREEGPSLSAGSQKVEEEAVVTDGLERVEQ